MDIKCWLTLHGSEYLFAMDSTYVRYCVYNLCSEVLVELPVYDFPVLIVVKQNNTKQILGGAPSLFFCLARDQKDNSHVISWALNALPHCVRNLLREDMHRYDILC